MNKDFHLYALDLSAEDDAKGFSGWGRSRDQITKENVYQALKAGLQAMRRYAQQNKRSYIVYAIISNEHKSQGTLGGWHVHCLIYSKSMDIPKQLRSFWVDNYFATHYGVNLKECWNGGKIDYNNDQAKKHTPCQHYFASDTEEQQALKQLNISKINKYYVIVGFSNYTPPKGITVLVEEWIGKNTPSPNGATVVTRHGKAVCKGNTRLIRFLQTF